MKKNRDASLERDRPGVAPEGVRAAAPRQARKRKAILTETRPVSFSGGKWAYETTEREVVVLAEAEGYAMIRRAPRAMPGVCSSKNLREILP